MPYEDFVVVIEDWGLTCLHPCGLAATVGHLRPVSDQLGLVLGHSPKDSCGEAASGGRRVQVRIEDHQRPEPCSGDVCMMRLRAMVERARRSSLATTGFRGRKVVLAFDADTAGAKAAARLHHLEAQQKLTLAVATLPSGTDPGDLGFTAPDQLRQCIDDAQPLMTFLVDRAIDAGDRDSIEGRVRTANRALVVVGEHPDPLVRDEYMMVVADRLQLDSGLLRQRLAELSGSPNSATPPPTVDGLAPIPQLELTAIRFASQTDDRRDLWWLDPLLYADPRARSVARALRHAATVAEAFENLEDKDRPALLVAVTERPLAGDRDEITARLVEAAIERRISSLDSTTPEDINRITVLRQQLPRLRPADTRVRAARTAYQLLSTH